MATSASMSVDVGSTATLAVEDGALEVRVTIKDVRESWGRKQYLVTPITGSGEKWVDGARVFDLQVPVAGDRR